MSTNVVDPTLMTALLQQGMAEGQMPALTIISNSMAPLIWKDDKVRLEPVQPADLQRGDVVVMQLPHIYMTHRYWDTLPNGQLLTRGDRPLIFDKVWQAENLVGRVTAIERGEKWVSLRENAGISLNNRLAQLSLLETKLFAPKLPTNTALPAPYKISTFFQRFPLGKRILRRGFYIWAKILIWTTIR